MTQKNHNENRILRLQNGQGLLPRCQIVLFSRSMNRRKILKKIIKCIESRVFVCYLLTPLALASTNRSFNNVVGSLGGNCSTSFFDDMVFNFKVSYHN